GRSRAHLLSALYCAAVALIEPLYVAGGFALYLNRRTALEGWDLEVQLRRIAQADIPQPLSAVAGLLLLAVALGVLAAVPGPTLAQDPGVRASSSPPERSRAAQEIKQILERPEFPHYETQLVIEPL